jgi:hypothetical protein
VSRELVEHAVHALEIAPSRCMEVDALYREVRRSAGRDVPMADFMAALRENPERLALVPPPVAEAAAWSADEVAAYARALQGTGLMAEPLVMLAVRESPADRDPDPPEPGQAAPERGLLEEVHGALVELLRAAGDAGLAAAAAGALSELEAARRRALSRP